MGRAKALTCTLTGIKARVDSESEDRGVGGGPGEWQSAGLGSYCPPSPPPTPTPAPQPAAKGWKAGGVTPDLWPGLRPEESLALLDKFKLLGELK